ncbi:hypothetical protein SAMN02982929_03262 [Saccharopolyspora kobensis]|uniref:Uncharacterized protein n=1 Tax=Saccharopolyspora kobensis TaxID=146035 RepID=A0A1H6CA20_9PSEU|nr:hypothetical protein [Saccharopolyspora kobensis]SEG69811.1 hypothetical protein SAMN02982929_03262 [Saccharopolyspora kobensis]SFC33545.1 hypothetical protein SAMN05216506_101504 [Saccharopolyspora kobensis]
MNQAEPAAHQVRPRAAENPVGRARAAVRGGLSRTLTGRVGVFVATGERTEEVDEPVFA